MKYRILWSALLTILAFSIFIVPAKAQSPGLIVDPKNGNGVTFLNPNGDKFTSATAAGFTTSDETQSEIPYKIVPAAISEPVGDQNGGANGGATDFVTNAAGNGFYAFYDGTNIMFRFRVGSLVSGAKGYSVLIDTDLRMGNSGFYADSNYVPQSASRSGNPGFELEVIYEYNKRVAIYNVDGSSNGTLMASYPVNTNAQISVALTRTSNDADYFVDFGVPVAALGIGTKYIRMVGTTLISTNSALDNNASDVFGIDDIPHKNLISNWEKIIGVQCGFPVSALSVNGSGICSCTPRPSVNSSINVGSNVAVTGMWNRLDPIKSSQATITLFQNGNIVGTTTATTGQTWSITVPSIKSGDVFYAKAQAAPEYMCLQSDPVTATCVSPAAPVMICASDKGMQGTIPLNTTVDIYQVITSNGSTTYTPISASLIHYSTGTTNQTFAMGHYQGNPCTQGSANTFSYGSYMAVSDYFGCLSAPTNFCITASGLSSSGSSAITLNGPIYNYYTDVSGSGTVSGNVLSLYQNNQQVATITASGSSFTFSNLTLSSGDQLKIYEQIPNSTCNSFSGVSTVQCYTAAPTITANNGNILTTDNSIGGFSSYPGATVSLYKGAAPGTLVGTAVVSSANKWWVNGLTLTAGDTYYATQNAGCNSVASNVVTVVAPTPVCPSITGTYYETDTLIQGTLPTPFTGNVRLFIDSAFIKSVAVTNATTWSIPMNTDLIYFTDQLSPSDVVSVTSQVPGGGETAFCSSTTINCVMPPTPSVSPTIITIAQGQSVNFNINGSSKKALYSLIDNSNGYYATSVFGNGNSQSLKSNSFNNTGTYNLKIVAQNLPGSSCITSTDVTVIVNGTTLPLHFINFTAKTSGAQSKELTWTVTNEQSISHYQVERSFDCTHFEPVATISAQASTGAAKQYSYTDVLIANAKAICYRIKAVSIDGAVMYSKVISLNESKEWQVQIAPNPTSNETTIYLNSEKEQIINIELIDVTGRAVMHKKVQAGEGKNAIVLPDLDKYAKGHYIVQVKTEAQLTHLQLVLN